jgi:hypothetical protein
MFARFGRCNVALVWVRAAMMQPGQRRSVLFHVLRSLGDTDKLCK